MMRYYRLLVHPIKRLKILVSVQSSPPFRERTKSENLKSHLKQDHQQRKGEEVELLEFPENPVRGF